MRPNEIQIEVTLFRGAQVALVGLVSAGALALACTHVYFNWQINRVIIEIDSMKRTMAAYHGAELKAIKYEKSPTGIDSSTR